MKRSTMSLRKLVLKEFKENLIEINYVYRLEDNKDVKFLKLLRLSVHSKQSQAKFPKCVFVCVCIWQTDSTFYVEMQRWE